MNTLLQKYYAPHEKDTGGGHVSQLASYALLQGPMSPVAVALDESDKAKIHEVGSLLEEYLCNINHKKVMLQQVDPRLQQSARLLMMQVQEWISHPIFKEKAALTASEIFAHAFGRVVCVENLRYAARKLQELRDPFIAVPEETLAAQLEYIAYDVENNFNHYVTWNKKIHDALGSVLNSLHDLDKMYRTNNTHHMNKNQKIAMQLLEQIAGELATNTISSLNGQPEVYRSHYFDFVSALLEYDNDLAMHLDKGHSHDKAIKTIQADYESKLQALIQSGGDDAIAAVTLISEALIGLTYKKILSNKVIEDNMPDVGNQRAKPQQKRGAKALTAFYQGHIELDGVDAVDGEGTHFAMIKPMLSEVKDRYAFLQYCRMFIALRNDVHSAVISAMHRY